MITPAVTDFLKEKAGKYYRYYRLFYNLFSILILAPIVVYSYSIMEKPFYSWQGYLLPVRYLLFIGGLYLFYAGSQHYSMRTFLGLTQIRVGFSHGLINSTGLIDRKGIMGVVRHPFYSGSFLIIWAGNLDMTRLIINIILSIYLVIGTLLEEKKLLVEFGNAYSNYQQEVSMLFPWKWITRMINSL